MPVSSISRPQPQPAGGRTQPGPAAGPSRPQPQPAAAVAYGTSPRAPGSPGAEQWRGLAQRYESLTGVPADIYLSLIQAESGGNAGIVGDNGASVGLFQLHERGVGYGYTVEQRQNPDLQFSLMAPRISNAYNEGIAQGLTGRDLAVYVGAKAERPAAGSEYRYGEAYDRITAGRNILGAPQPTTIPRGTSPASASLSRAPQGLVSVPAALRPAVSAVASAIAGYGAVAGGVTQPRLGVEGKDRTTLIQTPAGPITVSTRGSRAAVATIGGAALVLIALVWFIVRGAKAAGPRAIVAAARAVAGK